MKFLLLVVLIIGINAEAAPVKKTNTTAVNATNIIKNLNPTKIISKAVNATKAITKPAVPTTKVVDPERENKLNMVRKALRDLNDEYDSYVDAETQLYTRVKQVSQLQEKAEPSQLLELRKKVDDINKSLLKIKENKVKISQEMGKVLDGLWDEDRKALIKELNIQKKVDMYKVVNTILNKQKVQAAKEKKEEFLAATKAKIAKSMKAGEVEEKLSKKLKVSFYKKVALIQEKETTLRNLLESWGKLNAQFKGKNMCRFQLDGILKHTMLKAHKLMHEIRMGERELKMKRRLIVKNNLKGYHKVVDSLKKLIMGTKQAELKQLIVSKEQQVKAKKPEIKHEKLLKKSGKLVETEESKLSALLHKRVMELRAIKRHSACREDRLIWHLHTRRAFRLFDQLALIEAEIKK